MPLTKTGEKILKNFKDEYGAEKGKKVFYASINANPEKTATWHVVKQTGKKK